MVLSASYYLSSDSKFDTINSYTYNNKYNPMNDILIINATIILILMDDFVVVEKMIYWNQHYTWWLKSERQGIQRVKRKLEKMICQTTYYYIVYESAIDLIEWFSLYSDICQILLLI